MSDNNKRKIISRDDFQIQIKNVNSDIFSLAKVWIMYDRQNPNSSYFYKTAIEDAVQRIGNIPLVGYFMEEEENFGGHETELAIENNELVINTKTVPIGVVPESAELSWEKVKGKDGIERDYLVVNNVVVWNRNQKAVNALKTDTFGQSMEIDVLSGYMDNGVEYIEKFDFKALCILGVNKNGSGYVQPAFDDAKVQMYSKKDESLNKDIEDMFKDLKFALDDIKNKEDKKLKLENLLKKYSLTEDELKAKISNYSELTVEEVEAKLVEFAKADDEAKAKAKAKDEANKAKDEGKGKDRGDKSPEVAKLEEKVAKLEKENEELKARIKELTSANKKFEIEKHIAECKDVVDTFVAEYGLSEESAKSINLETVESTDILNSKLFELLGREAKKKEKEFSPKVPAFPKKTEDEVSSVSFAKYFE